MRLSFKLHSNRDPVQCSELEEWFFKDMELKSFETGPTHRAQTASLIGLLSLSMLCGTTSVVSLVLSLTFFKREVYFMSLVFKKNYKNSTFGLSVPWIWVKQNYHTHLSIDNTGPTKIVAWTSFIQLFVRLVSSHWRCVCRAYINVFLMAQGGFSF